MKQVILITLCALFSFAQVNAQDTVKKDKKETITLLVEGMDCANCVKKIEKNIAFEKGVTDLKCDLATKTATVTYRTDRTDEAKVLAAFKKIGMEAKVQKEGEAQAAKACCGGCSGSETGHKHKH